MLSSCFLSTYIYSVLTLWNNHLSQSIKHFNRNVNTGCNFSSSKNTEIHIEERAFKVKKTKWKLCWLAKSIRRELNCEQFKRIYNREVVFKVYSFQCKTTKFSKTNIITLDWFVERVMGECTVLPQNFECIIEQIFYLFENRIEYRYWKCDKDNKNGQSCKLAVLFVTNIL